MARGSRFERAGPGKNLVATRVTRLPSHMPFIGRG